VGEALQKIGFKLVGGQPLVGLNKEAMEAQVEEFGKLAKNADIALFYFSGHGVQLNGTNFLVPVGFQSGKSPIVHALSTTVLMAELARSQARVKIVLLDACRTPFMKGGDGLAPMQDFAVNGTVIGFATQPNRTAWAGPPNGNSPYAKAFATKLSVKGLQLYDLLIDVGLEVMSVTQNAQVPSATITPLRVVLNQNQINRPCWATCQTAKRFVSYRAHTRYLITRILALLAMSSPKVYSWILGSVSHTIIVDTLGMRRD
jgi:uncharacterized caspase-like protein